MRACWSVLALAVVVCGCNKQGLLAAGSCASGVQSSAASSPDAVPANADALIAAMDVPVTATNASLKDIPNQAAAFAGLGTMHPTKGTTFAYLATGVAGAGTTKTLDVYATSTQNAEGIGGQPCDFDPWSFDCAVLSFSVVAPSDAQSLAFDFNFVSTEYPEFVGSNYNDSFIVSESSPTHSYPNLVFDANGHPINVNNVFFVEPCTQLTGTGYDIYNQFDATACDAGGTGLLTTSAPVTGGETVTMTFTIYDEADAWLDSGVMIDNFRFDDTPVTTPTTTVPDPTPTPPPSSDPPCPPPPAPV